MTFQKETLFALNYRHVLARRQNLGSHHPTHSSWTSPELVLVLVIYVLADRVLPSHETSLV